MNNNELVPIRKQEIGGTSNLPVDFHQPKTKNERETAAAERLSGRRLAAVERVQNLRKKISEIYGREFELTDLGEIGIEVEEHLQMFLEEENEGESIIASGRLIQAINIVLARVDVQN